MDDEMMEAVSSVIAKLPDLYACKGNDKDSGCGVVLVYGFGYGENIYKDGDGEYRIRRCPVCGTKESKLLPVR